MKPWNGPASSAARSGEPHALIRFVASPDGVVVADLKGRLPGRGAWVTARRDVVEQAIAKRLFARALKRDVTVAGDLADAGCRSVASRST